MRVYIYVLVNKCLIISVYLWKM